MSRSWTVRIPCPAPWLNANSRKDRRRAAATVRTWREAAHIYATQAKLPKLARARITATLHFCDKRRRDDHNYFPTIKAIVDGLVDYGLLDDDSREHLVGTSIAGGEPVTHKQYPGGGLVVLTIQEAP